MSHDVGGGERAEGSSRASKLRDALVGGVEVRGVDRILADSFWRASSRPSGGLSSSAPIANVCTLPVRRT
jgi:hypothetical protein